MKVAAIALFLGALAYASFLTEAILGYPLSPTVAYLSELSAIDQPSSALVRPMDAVSGVLFAGVGVYLWKAWRTSDLITWPLADRGSRLTETLRSIATNGYLLVSSGLILTGVSTVLDAAFPMDCAESIASCRAQLAAGASFAHHAHAVTSAIAGTGLVIVAVGAFLLGSWATKSVAAVVVVAMGFQLATLVVAMPIGIAQRIQVAASVVLMMMLAWQIGGGHVGYSSGPRTHAK